MLGLLAPTLIALAAAFALGGSFRKLVAGRVYGWPAIVACFAIELVLFNPPVNSQTWAMQSGPWVWLATRLVFLSALVANGWPARHGLFWPWWLAAFGMALNTLVIALNGGHMPQSPEAALSIWDASRFDPNRLQNVVPLGPETRLPWLADIFAEPVWLPRPNVVSAGDILLALGVASWVFSSTTRSQSVTSSAEIVGKA
jgi:hypothetical protein